MHATRATFVHAFEDERVIAGQGTIGLELVEQLPSVGTIVIPIGGGGLAAGVAIALRELRPEVRLVGVQAENVCPFAGGTEHRFTIAEGIAVKQPGTLTTAILRDRLDEVVTVTDEQISHAIVLLLERTKLLVEGAGAASVAALLAGKVPGDDEACLILSGGNIDPTLLIQVMRHGLTQAGRYLVLRTRIVDRPGELIKLLQLVAEERGNVVSVEHHREGMALPIGETEVELTLATRDEAHCRELLAALASRRYVVESLN
jgi:threonine dehydratase